MSKSLVIFLSLTLGILSFSAKSQDLNALRKKHFNTEKSIAIQGYDPVSYFSESKAKKETKNLPIIMETPFTIFLQRPTWTYSKPIRINTNLNLVDGAPMPWENQAKK